MNKKTKLIIQIALLVMIVLFIINQQELFFTSNSAYRHIERYLHFGPATELHTVDDFEGRYILAEYDDWVAVFHIWQRYGFLYTPRAMVAELEIKNEEIVIFQVNDLYFSDNERHFIVSAYAKDSITTLEIERRGNSPIILESITDNIYFDHWPSGNTETNLEYIPTMIRGYDEVGELVYEEEIE